MQQKKTSSFQLPTNVSEALHYKQQAVADLEAQLEMQLTINRQLDARLRATTEVLASVKPGDDAQQAKVMLEQLRKQKAGVFDRKEEAKQI